MSYRAFAAHNELIMAHGSPLGTYQLVSGFSSLMGVCCSWDVSCQAAGGGFPPWAFFVLSQGRWVSYQLLLIAGSGNMPSVWGKLSLSRLCYILGTRRDGGTQPTSKNLPCRDMW